MAVAAVAPARAAVFADPAGDFLPTYTGPAGGDLDVRSVEALLSPAGAVTLNATFAAPVGTTAGGFYVWGIDRGAGTARFGAAASNVLFDAVVVIQQNGTGSFSDLLNSANNFTLNPSAITINGTLLSVTLPFASLPSTGFATSAYGYNLWPRAGGISGLAAISDFAPNNADIQATVPEPASWALLLTGFAAVGTALRRRAVRLA